MDNYIIIEELATTVKAKIYKAKNKKTKEIIALKVINEPNSNEAPSKETLRELLVIMNFEHDNLVQFKNVFVNNTNIVIEMAFCTTNLFTIINTISKPFTLFQIKKVVRLIAEGMKFLHTNQIIHRDIKPSNILIDDMCNVKICDFGSSRIVVNSKLYTASIGTKWYKSPEILVGSKEYTQSCDIWSFGCLIAELFLLEPLFCGGSDYEVISKIIHILGYSKEDDEALNSKTKFLICESEENLRLLLDQCDEEAFDLISKMLVLNPEKRISINEVIKHNFLKNEERYLKTHLPV